MNRNEAIKVLGLPSYEFTKEDLNRGFRDAVKETHPDMGGNVDSFTEVMRAYHYLQKDIPSVEEEGDIFLWAIEALSRPLRWVLNLF